MNAGHLVFNVEPRITAEVFVGRVDEEKIQPRQVHRLRHPAVAVNAVAEAVEHDHQAARGFFGGGNEFAVEHRQRFVNAARNFSAAASLQSMSCLTCAAVSRASGCNSVYCFGGISL